MAVSEVLELSIYCYPTNTQFPPGTHGGVEVRVIMGVRVRVKLCAGMSVVIREFCDV